MLHLDSVWGVIDFVPDTDFPDFRCMTYIHSHAGTLFIIPREKDIIRLYIQQSDATVSDLVDPATQRVDKNRSSPEKLLEQGQKILSGYRMEVKEGHPIAWWTIYIGEP